MIFDSFANLVVRPKFKRFPESINVLEYRTLERVWYLFDPRRYARDHLAQYRALVDSLGR